MTPRFILGPLLFIIAMSAAQAQSLFEISLKDIEGKEVSLEPYRGRVLLIVNVASACGYTGQ